MKCLSTEDLLVSREMKGLEFDNCPTFEIAAYIDGELDAGRVLELESHFAGCPSCAEDLNHQKQFLLTLSNSLRNEGEIDLPKDFTKQIVARAESHVVGLRGSRERFNAVFIIVALSLFVLFALGAEAGTLVSWLKAVVHQALSVGGFFGRLVYSFFIGFVVIVRTFAAPFQTGLLVSLVFVAFASVIFARFFGRLRRN